MATCPMQFPSFYPDLDPAPTPAPALVPAPPPAPDPDPDVPAVLPGGRLAVIGIEVLPIEKPEFWNHARVVGLAKVHCAQCHGLGRHWNRNTQDYQPCNCVLREIFRACLSKYRYIQLHQGQPAGVTMSRLPNGRDAKISYGRRNEEYCADFCVVAKRTLAPLDRHVFDLHFLRGFDWHYCTEALGLDRGNFFHAVYCIESMLGRAFTELLPYALYPVDEYFSTNARFGRAARSSALVRRMVPLSPPLRAAA